MKGKETEIHKAKLTKTVKKLKINDDYKKAAITAATKQKQIYSFKCVSLNYSTLPDTCWCIRMSFRICS